MKYLFKLIITNRHSLGKIVKGRRILKGTHCVGDEQMNGTVSLLDVYTSTYLFAEGRKPVLGGEVKEIQHGSAVAANGTVERVPDGPVDSIVDRVQAGDRDQRTGRTTQLGRKVEFRVIDHGRHESERQQKNKLE